MSWSTVPRREVRDKVFGSKGVYVAFYRTTDFGATQDNPALTRRSEQIRLQPWIRLLGPQYGSFVRPVSRYVEDSTDRQVPTLI